MGRAQRILMLWRWWAARQRYLRQVSGQGRPGQELHTPAARRVLCRFPKKFNS